MPVDDVADNILSANLLDVVNPFAEVIDNCRCLDIHRRYCPSISHLRQPCCIRIDRAILSFPVSPYRFANFKVLGNLYFLLKSRGIFHCDIGRYLARIWFIIRIQDGDDLIFWISF